MNDMRPIRAGCAVIVLLIVIWSCTIENAQGPTVESTPTPLTPTDGAEFDEAIANLNVAIEAGETDGIAASRSALSWFIAFLDAFETAASTADDYDGPSRIDVVTPDGVAQLCAAGPGALDDTCLAIEAIHLNGEHDHIDDIRIDGVWLSERVVAPRAERVGAVDRGFVHHRGSFAGPGGATIVVVQIDAGTDALYLPAHQWRFTAAEGGFWTPQATIGPSYLGAGESAVVAIVLNDAPLVGEVTVLMANEETGHSRTIDLRIN